MQVDNGRQPALGVVLVAERNRRRGIGSARQQQGQHAAGNQDPKTGGGGWHAVLLEGDEAGLTDRPLGWPFLHHAAAAGKVR